MPSFIGHKVELFIRSKTCRRKLGGLGSQNVQLRRISTGSAIQMQPYQGLQHVNRRSERAVSVPVVLRRLAFFRKTGLTFAFAVGVDL